MNVKPILPALQPSKVNKELVDNTIQHLRKYHTIADFRLIIQNEETISQDSHKNKIHIVYFFIK